MTFRPLMDFRILWVIAALSLAACQADPDAVRVTSQATSSAFTPTARQATRTLPARTRTPAASPSPALPDYLAVDPNDLKGVEIDFWFPWQGELAEAAELLAAEFSQSNDWGIRVERKPFYTAGALYEEIEAGLADNRAGLPDVVAAPADQLAAWSEQAGVIADLSGYLDHPQVGWSAQEVEAFHPIFWNQDRLNDQQVGVPLLRSARVLFYNETWARELGFKSPPATPDEFREQACAAAVANNGLRLLDKLGTGGWLIDDDPLTLLSWLGAFGAQALPEDGSSAYQFESEEAEEALAFLRGMLNDGCAWLGRNQTQYDYFASRTALFYTGSLQDIYVQKEFNERAGNKDEWTVLPFPGLEGMPVVYASGYSLALIDPLGGPPQDDQARKESMAGWLFIRWLSQPRNQARLAETLPSIPVSRAIDAQLVDYRRNFPWDMILPLREAARPAPGSASWRIVRRLVEDASWQIYHLPADQVELILPQLDSAAEEFLEQE